MCDLMRMLNYVPTRVHVDHVLFSISIIDAINAHGNRHSDAKNIHWRALTNQGGALCLQLDRYKCSLRAMESGVAIGVSVGCSVIIAISRDEQMRHTTSDAYTPITDALWPCVLVCILRGSVANELPLFVAID